ncbi:hypothetical protein [Pasteurella sp. PK-2025]|uniref:hypothetical protein n=1 Tax=unclassified Pasteurella TaxID=2621516 RepID=UPI003C755A34
MAINFTKIFQDSWNFVRNTRQITFTFVLLFFLNHSLSSLVAYLLIPEDVLTQNPEQFAQSLNLNNTADPLFYILIIVNHVISFLLSLWCLSAIHQVSHSLYVPSTSLALAVKRFVGAFIINLLLVIPLLLGAADAVFSLIVAKSQPSVFSWTAIALGAYIFIRCCLASVYYLFNPISITQALRESWQSANQRMFMLLIYCVLIYFVLPLIGRKLITLNDHLVFELIVTLLIAFLNVFSLVFTYRFYSIFMHKV